MRENNISSLPKQLSSADSLKVLDVSGNRLNYLPIELASLSLTGSVITSLIYLSNDVITSFYSSLVI